MLGAFVGVWLANARLGQVDTRWNRPLLPGVKCACGQAATVRLAFGRLDWSRARQTVLCEQCAVNLSALVPWQTNAGARGPKHRGGS